MSILDQGFNAYSKDIQRVAKDGSGSTISGSSVTSEYKNYSTIKFENEKFSNGVYYINLVLNLLSECRSLLNDMSDCPGYSEIYNFFNSLVNKYNEIDEMIEKHRKYLADHNYYQQYVDSSMIGIESELGKITLDENDLINSSGDYEETLSRYYSFSSESAKTRMYELIDREEKKIITDAEMHELLTYRLSDIQNDLSILSPKSDEYLNKMLEYYQYQIDYYEKKSTIEHAEMKYLCDLYVQKANYEISWNMMKENSYYAEGSLYYSKLGEYNARTKTGYVFEDLGSRGQYWQQSIYRKFKEQFVVENSYYELMTILSNLESNIKKYEEEKDAEGYYRLMKVVYEYYVKMYDNVINYCDMTDEQRKALIQTREDYNRKAELYKELEEIHDKRNNIIYINTYNKFINMLNIKRELGIATEEELEILNMPKREAKKYMNETRFWSFTTSFLGTVGEILLDGLMLLAAGYAQSQANQSVYPPQQDYISDAVDFVEQDLTKMWYDHVVDQLAINEYIAYDVWHTKASSLGGNAAILLTGIITQNYPALWATFSAGMTVERLCAQGVDGNAAILIGLAIIPTGLAFGHLKSYALDSAVSATTSEQLLKLGMINAGLEAGNKLLDLTIEYTMLDALGYKDNEYLKFIGDNMPMVAISSVAALTGVYLSNASLKTKLTNNLSLEEQAIIQKLSEKTQTQIKNNPEMMDEVVVSYLKESGIDFDALSEASKSEMLKDPMIIEEASEKYLAIFATKQAVTRTLDTCVKCVEMSALFTSSTATICELRLEALEYYEQYSEGILSLDSYTKILQYNKKIYENVDSQLAMYLPSADNYISDELVLEYMKVLCPNNKLIQSATDLTSLARSIKDEKVCVDFVTFQSANPSSNNIISTGFCGSGTAQMGGVYAIPKWYLEEYARKNPDVCKFDFEEFQIYDYERFRREVLGDMSIDTSMGLYMIETRVPINNNNISIPSVFNMNNYASDFLTYISSDADGTKIVPSATLASFAVGEQSLTNKWYTDDDTQIRYNVSYIGGN